MENFEKFNYLKRGIEFNLNKCKELEKEKQKRIENNKDITDIQELINTYTRNLAEDCSYLSEIYEKLQYCNF